RPTPLRPAQSASQFDCVPMASGDTSPTPVTTTRLLNPPPWTTGGSEDPAYFLVFACDSMYSMASFTRVIFSASSSGISIPNSSSKAITSSTVSSESAPRSSPNEASGVTSSSSTPSCSTMMLFTLSATAIQPSNCRLSQSRPAIDRRVGRPGLHVPAAVDGENLTRNIRCLVRGEETYRCGNIVRRAETFQGDLC